MANLRTIGCPEATIRDIVTLRVCHAYRKRMLDLRTELALKQVENPYLDDTEARKFIDQQRVLRDEMISEVESVLGVDWAVLSSSLIGNAIAEDPLNKTLSAEKRAQIREITSQFRRDVDNLQSRVRAEGMGKDEIAAYRSLQNQNRDALAAVLSPQELEEYLYRNSPAADYVKRNQPQAKSEAEYRTMVKLALEMGMSYTLDSIEQRFGMSPVTDETSLESRKRREEYAQRLKELLGEDRIADQQAEERARASAETQRQKDEAEQRRRQEMIDKAVEAGVSADVAGRFIDRLKASQADLNQKFNEMEKSLSGTQEEKRKQMEAAIKAELDAMAIETMGERGPSVVEKIMKSGK